ncbi:glycosyltransferase [uncultured Paraglaciecola sp.]|uniref:glycosyltransferase n=1 Tax=uncultured Paraglaciecola sp. TaxID=1765024 RepID=UPI0030D6CF2A
MTKISVMHITYDMRIGGTEMVIKNLIEGSDPEVFEMSIFCVEEPLGPWGVDLQNNGIQISSKARKPGFDTSLISAIRQHIKLNKIDIIHCHQYTPWVYGVIAAFGTKTKVILTEHGRFYPDSSSWKRKLINPLLSKITDCITSISKATLQALVEFENIPSKKIQLVYNGIRPPEINPQKTVKLKDELAFTNLNLVFGTIARLDPIKNHPLMINAFAAILKQFPNSKLIIVGDGEERLNICKLIEKLGIQSSIIMPGYDPQPQHYLELMDVFMLTSLSEGTSMTLLEAMALGKPCIVTNAGGNPEIVIHEKTGLVCDNDDLPSLISAMLSMSKDIKIRNQYAEASKIRFSELFENSIMINNYANIYQKLSKHAK